MSFLLLSFASAEDPNNCLLREDERIMEPVFNGADISMQLYISRMVLALCGKSAILNEKYVGYNSLCKNKRDIG